METTSTVFLTRDITPESLVRIYKALGRKQYRIVSIDE